MKSILKGVAFIAALIIWIILQQTGVIDLSGLHAFIETYSGCWWMPVVFLASMIVMYAFALPASGLILVAGVIYTPPVATLLSVTGGVAGSVAAYYLVRHLSTGFRRRHAEGSVMRLMKKHAGLTLLCALRLFPGFPHSVINYSSGLVRANIVWFIISAAIGFSVKSFIYTSAVYRATHYGKGHGAPGLQALWPLAALAVFLVAGLIGGKLLVPKIKSARRKDKETRNS